MQRIDTPREITARPAIDASRVDPDAILTALAPDVRCWVFRYIGARADIDDVVQEALIQLADALHRFRGESSLRTYARRIVIRAASRHARARHSAPLLQLVSESAGPPDPENIAMQRETLRRLYAALGRLTPGRRTAFVLCAIERLPHDEAAAIEDVSVDTLRLRLKRARRDLADLLRNDAYLAPLFREES